MFDSSERRGAALQSVFEGYDGSPFSIRFWDGWQWSVSSGAAPACTIILRNAKSSQILLAAPNEISLGEAFIRRDLDVCLLYTSPSPRDPKTSRMPSSA